MKGWSLSGKFRPLKTPSTPGPGAYYQPERIKSPMFSVGRSKRHNPVKSYNPGPGTYRYYTPLNRGIRIGGSVRPERQIPDNPGPGTYELEFKPNSPHFSIRSRTGPKERLKSPGPGKYSPNTSKLWKDPPRTIIGTQKKFLDNETASPGPGAYKTLEVEKIRGVDFGSSKRITRLSSVIY